MDTDDDWQIPDYRDRAVRINPKGPHVYLLWGNDPDRPLYVGVSSNVLSRLGGHLHGGKGRQTRYIELVRCRGLAEARVLESKLIWAYQPSLNVRLKGDADDLPEKFVGRTWA
jgi:excinuclease UvrABC nuclease subunit